MLGISQGTGDPSSFNLPSSYNFPSPLRNSNPSTNATAVDNDSNFLAGKKSSSSFFQKPIIAPASLKVNAGAPLGNYQFSQGQLSQINKKTTNLPQISDDRETIDNLNE